MKKIVVVLIMAFVMVSCSNVPQTNFSKEALSEKLFAIDGSQIIFKDILEKHKGKTIIIDIWASWCGDCIKAIPQIKELQTNNPEVAYLFISMDRTTTDWKKGIIKHQLKGEHFMAKDQMNGVFGTVIDLDQIPRYIIIDKSTKIALYKAHETDFEKINTVLKELQ